MNRPWVILTGRYGDDTESPTLAQLASAMSEVYHETLPEMTEGDYAVHDSAWLRYGEDDGPMLVLDVNRSRVVTLEEWTTQDYEEELAPSRTMQDVREEQALQLWRCLAAGQIDQLRAQPWQ